MRHLISAILCMIIFSSLSGQKPQDTEDWSREPEKVTPGEGTNPPSDAIVLYGGSRDIEKWESERGGPARWDAGEVLTIVPGTGSIRTRQSFGDVQLHLEWRVSADVKGKGQDRGNSGIYLMGLYEVQVLDSYKNKTYNNGQAGSIYKQYIPLVNASLPPGKWQTYDIIFRAPRFNSDESLQEAACVTVLHNGVLVQNHVKLKGPTVFIGKPAYKAHPGKLPLMIQDHNHEDSFRNIWIREL